jgi:hypothetical protein
MRETEENIPLGKMYSEPSPSLSITSRRTQNVFLNVRSISMVGLGSSGLKQDGEGDYATSLT